MSVLISWSPSPLRKNMNLAGRVHERGIQVTAKRAQGAICYRYATSLTIETWRLPSIALHGIDWPAAEICFYILYRHIHQT